MLPGRVRIAQQSDEEEVMGLCRELHVENGIFGMNEDKVRAMLRRAFERQGAIVGVIGDPGKIEGVICLTLSTFWYSDDAQWEELFSFVKKEYRKSKDALDLMDFARWCSDTSKIPIIIGVISNERTAGKVRLYQRKFSPIGAFFFYPDKKAS